MTVSTSILLGNSEVQANIASKNMYTVHGISCWQFSRSFSFSFLIFLNVLKFAVQEQEPARLFQLKCGDSFYCAVDFYFSYFFYFVVSFLLLRRSILHTHLVKKNMHTTAIDYE